MTSACNEIDVFVKVLKSSIMSYVNGKDNNEDILQEIAVSLKLLLAYVFYTNRCSLLIDFIFN